MGDTFPFALLLPEAQVVSPGERQCPGIEREQCSSALFRVVSWVTIVYLLIGFLKSSPEDIVLIFRERGREGERGEEKHLCEKH